MGERYVKGLSLADLFPHRSDGLCRCGCGQQLEGRRTSWATDACNQAALNHFYVVKGDTASIRHQLWARDGGVCRRCGVRCSRYWHDHRYTHLGPNWAADHIIELADGGQNSLANLQTLCVTCHAEKTALNAAHRRRQQKAQQLPL